MRLFVAVELGEAVIAAAARAIDEGRRHAGGAKWVTPANLHLTLVFLGPTADELVAPIGAAVAAVAARHPPLTLRIEGGGAFGSPRRPRVLWCDVRGEVEALARIRLDLEAALAPFGHEPELRAYRPHLTLARARDGRGDPALAEAVRALEGLALGEVRIDRLVLFRSDLSPRGPTYAAVAGAALLAP